MGMPKPNLGTLQEQFDQCVFNAQYWALRARQLREQMNMIVAFTELSVKYHDMSELEARRMLQLSDVVIYNQPGVLVVPPAEEPHMDATYPSMDDLDRLFDEYRPEES